MTQDQPDVLEATWIVDGIEDRYARVELPNGEVMDVPLASLPRDVREGDVIQVRIEGGDLTLEIDDVETARRREEAQARLEALNTAPAGEIDL